MIVKVQEFKKEDKDMRTIWFILGSISLILGIVGIILPLLPTVPFFLLSAFFFARSSQRVHNWLINHKIFGKMIRDWNERAAISIKAKYLATLSIGLVLVLSIVMDVKLMVIYIQIVVLSMALLFIWTRPNT